MEKERMCGIGNLKGVMAKLKPKLKPGFVVFVYTQRISENSVPRIDISEHFS